MSGGSYNYLYMKDASELLHMQGTLEEMANTLAAGGYKNASIATWGVLLAVRKYSAEIEARASELSAIWKEVEWRDSGDGGDIEGAVNKWLEASRL